ncbi:group II intron maturase-specific domain-containing protein [Aeribacillus composti]|uniref:group II intron maturase-specific domain-containing protein n=1 Tax=Aeribacillus TaxID=1055323 RepID=UPI002E1E9B80|nr:group II intron maturase-specific domain-containing protein [Aeribacillus composti]
MDIKELVKGLNRILQGFKNYYSISSIAKKWINKVDWYVLERLTLYWNKKKNQRKKHARMKEVIKLTQGLLVKLAS